LTVRPPSLRSIAAFEAAARHRSFTKAAAELNLTSGAVSHAIKALETRLGKSLFERIGRKVSLTPAGQALAPQVRLSLSLLGDAFDVSPWLTRGRLAVSTLPSIAHKILLPALAEFLRSSPELRLDLRCSDTLAELGGEVDVAIRFGPGGWSGLQSRQLAGERLFPVASPQYRPNLPSSFEELRACNLIQHPESSWRLWLEPLGWNFDDLHSTLAIDDSIMVLEAAAEGMGVGLARSQLVQSYLRSGRLVRLFDHDVAAEYSYWAVWNGGSPKRDLIESFVAWVKGAFFNE
jgi:LysR family glycine cleavage system transcriptional activator